MLCVPPYHGSDEAFQLPFAFVVPGQLLPSAGQNEISTDNLRDNHLILPPCLGRPANIDTAEGLTEFLAFDMTPEMAQIVYELRVGRLVQARS